jgi:hypothetical protein
LIKISGKFEEIRSLKSNWGCNWRYTRPRAILKKTSKIEGPNWHDQGLDRKKSWEISPNWPNSTQLEDQGSLCKISKTILF